MHIPTYNQNVVNQCFYPRHFGISYSTIGYVLKISQPIVVPTVYMMI
jgi:hypothetical protein